MHKLVVVADDFGLDENRDRGIIECFTSGGVRAASIIANGPHSLHAAKKAQRVAMPVHLHLNLTEGTPVSSLNKVSSLLSNGTMLGKFGFRNALSFGKINAKEVATEIISQLEWFFSVFGYYPPHIDGHQHIHVQPIIRNVLTPILVQYGVRSIRMPYEQSASDGVQEWVPKQRADYHRQIVMEAIDARLEFKAADICMSDGFVGLGLMGENSSVDMLATCVAMELNRLNAQPGEVLVLEWMTHPGHPGKGWDEFNESEDREKELQVVKLDSLNDMLLSKEWCEVIEIGSVFDLYSSVEPKSLLAVTPGMWKTGSGGNLSTINRITRGVQPLWKVDSVWDCQNIRNENSSLNDFWKVVSVYEPKALLAIHAYKSAHVILSSSIPVVLVLGGTDLNDDVYNVDRRRVIEQVVQKARVVVCFSEYLLHKCVSFFGEAILPKLVIIPQSVHVPRSLESKSKFSLLSTVFSIMPSNPVVFVCVCGLRAVKGVSLFLESAMNWTKKNPNIGFVIIGPVIEKDVETAVMEIAVKKTLFNRDTNQSCDTDNKLVYCEPVPRFDLLSCLEAERNSIVLVNSSVSEGMSGIILECMAREVPILARNNDGNSSLVEHGVSGLLFSCLNEFAESANMLAGSSEQRKLLAVNARKRVLRNFSVDRERCSYQSILNRCLV